jgi:hypothetical protein
MTVALAWKNLVFSSPNFAHLKYLFSVSNIFAATPAVFPKLLIVAERLDN